MSNYATTQKLISEFYEEGDIDQVFFAEILATARCGDESKVLRKSDEEVFHDALEICRLLIGRGDFSLCRRTARRDEFEVSVLDLSFVEQMLATYQSDASERDHEFALFLQNTQPGVPAPIFSESELSRLRLE